MNQVHLKVKSRETGKQISKKYRREGLVPGVFYTKGDEPIAILSDPLSLRPIVYTSQTRIVDLEIEGQPDTRECVIKDVVFDPVTDKIIHFDLLGVIRGQKLSIEIPVVLKGQAIGVREGGISQHTLHRVVVTCLPKHLPNSIEVDISELKIGDSVSLKDIEIENVEFDVPMDTKIVSVVPPRVSSDDKTEAGGEEVEGEEAPAQETASEE